MKAIKKVSVRNKDMEEERIFYKEWSYMACIKKRHLNRYLKDK